MTPFPSTTNVAGTGRVLRAIGTVEEIERMAELAVKLLQFFSNLENDAKLPGHFIPHIAQHGESQFIFFLCAQRIVRQLRRDGLRFAPQKSETPSELVASLAGAELGG